jgi:hypothetical protein
MIEKIAMWLVLGGFVAMMNGLLLMLVAYAISEI